MQMEKASLQVLEAQTALAAASVTLTYSPKKLTLTRGSSLVAIFSHETNPLTDEKYTEEQLDTIRGSYLLRRSSTIYGYHPEKILSAGAEYEKHVKTWVQSKTEQLRKRITTVMCRGPFWEAKLKSRDPEQRKEFKQELEVRVREKLKRYGRPMAIIKNQPGAPTLFLPHIQEFIRDLKTEIAADVGPDFEIAYYYAAEYGTGKGRPHFHINIFLRSFPEKINSEQFAQYLLGDHPGATNPTIGPVQRAWKKADWSKIPDDQIIKHGKFKPSAFRNKCFPFEKPMAMYIAKYTMKSQRGVGTAENIETAQPIRVDGSIPEFVRGSKGKKGRSIGYPSIEFLAPHYKQQQKIVAAIPSERWNKILDIGYKIIHSNSSVTDAEINEVVKDSGLTTTQVNAYMDLFSLITEHIPVKEGKKRYTIRGNLNWRTRLYEAIGIPQEEIDITRQYVAEASITKENRLTDSEYLNEIETSKRKAQQWKQGALAPVSQR